MTTSQSSARSLTSDAHPAFERAPFRWTHQQQTSLPVHVEGTLPAWLRGDLLRTAPAVFARAGWHAEHWFDGLGLIYAFRFSSTGVHFQQRLLDCDVARDVERERQQVASFGTPTTRSLVQRVLRPVPLISDNANVNIVPWQGAWLAMTETPHQHVIDGETLASRGHYAYHDALPSSLGMTAHPHFDFERRALVNVGTTFGPKNELWVYRQKEGESRREVEGKLAFKRVPYVHSFGLTPQHALVIDHPFTLNPLKLLFSNRPYSQPFEWQPRNGTRLWKLHRQTGKWSSYETDPLFCFHVVNAFEDGEDTVLDFVAFDTAGIVQELGRAALDRQFPGFEPRFLRARMRPGSKRVELEPLSSRGFEFPIMPYRQQNGRRYSTAWGARIASQDVGDPTSELVRIDIGRDQTASFSEPSMSYGEPVFVQRPGAERADDGVLLAVGSHAHEDRTALVVLRADTLEPLAHARVELSIPLGFHGTFAHH